MVQLAKIFGLIFGVGFALCQFLIYNYAPLEQTMQEAQKIFYYHLPMAWWTFVAFSVTFVCSICYLRTKKNIYDSIALASTEIGVLFATLALITGSVWGKNSWNTWWTWDPRLTTTLVMWFIYAGYLAIRSMPMPNNKSATIAAVVGIFGFIDVPLVFLSARIWRSIHPNVFASSGGGLETEMLITVLACVGIFFFLYFSLMVLRTSQIQTNKLMENATKELLEA